MKAERRNVIKYSQDQFEVSPHRPFSASAFGWRGKIEAKKYNTKLETIKKILRFQGIFS